MKQIWITRAGPPSVLELREAPDPTPGPGEVRVAVEASGVNFADLMARMGLYPDAPHLPCVVGYEAAGAIDAVGPGVDAARVGEPVVAMTRFGGYSTHVILPADNAVRRPDGLDAVTAASIPVTGLTAWMILEEMGRVRAGDRVLVHSAGGGVGLMALDLIKARGATAVGIASKGKHAFLAERGYDRLIDGRAEDWEAQLGGAERVDLVLDPVGGESWAKGLRVLAPGGRLVCYGMSANSQTDSRSVLTVLRNFWQVPWRLFNPVSLMNENRGALGVNMGHLWDEGPRLRGWLGSLLEMWQAGQLRPHVHATVPFSQAAEAHRILHDRENLGKVILVPDPAG